MEEKIIVQFAEYGLAGLIILALFFVLWTAGKHFLKFVNKMHEDHLEERKTWSETFKQQIDSSNEQHEKLNETLRELVREIAKK